MKVWRSKYSLIILMVLACVLIMGEVAEAKWPTRPVEFIIPAGTGGGADRYARFLVGLNVKGKYIDQAILPVNKAGGAGAVAMQHLLSQKGNGHMMMITLNSFITTPLFQSLPFSYRDYTPIYLLALDNFPLWVHKDAKWKTAADFVAEAKTRSITVGGTGSKQEDEIVWRAVEKIAGIKPVKYVPYKGGGAVAKALVGKHIEATVNQVSEAGPFFPDFVRPLCVFQDARLDAAGYENVPTGKEAGIDLSYQMMRGIFAPPGISQEAEEGLVKLFTGIAGNEEWLAFAAKTGLKPDNRTGADFLKFVEAFEKTHVEIMKAQGWIK